MGLEADQRIVGGAAAEIRHQHIGVLLQALGEIIGGRHRLVDIVDFRKTGTRQRFVVAGERQRLIRIAAGETHGRPAMTVETSLGHSAPA